MMLNTNNCEQIISLKNFIRNSLPKLESIRRIYSSHHTRNDNLIK